MDNRRATPPRSGFVQPCGQPDRPQVALAGCCDYAKGAGNGALLPGRRRSSFTFAPDWHARPWPPRGKHGHGATDEELGL